MFPIDLSFARINILREDIAELVVNEGVELTAVQVRQVEDTLASYLKSPFSLLINKIYNYSYQFDAIIGMGKLPQLQAVAIVCHRQRSYFTVEPIIHLKQSSQWQIRRFFSKADALEWLFSFPDTVDRS